MNGAVVAGIAVAVVAAMVVVGVGIYTISAYNNLVGQENDVDESWAQVVNEYQRKVDLIPALVSAAEGYQEFESSTLTNITALRSAWMAADTQTEQMNISAQMDVQLAQISVVYENYPYLQSITVVSEVMVQLEGTENRITVARMRYNANVKDYNNLTEKFPSSLIASSFGFEEKRYYDSGAGPDQP